MLLAIAGVGFAGRGNSSDALRQIMRCACSERLLALVQRFDAPSNSFPSMHTSVAMLTALHLAPQIGMSAFLFPVMIGVSCLLTKQHYLIDVPPGALLGWIAYELYARLTAA